MAATFTPEIMTKIKEVTSKPYAEQAIFYLNAFWAQGAEAEAETVWGLVEAFAKEDHVKGKNGCELNAVQAFSVLQKRNQTLTALELKAQLRKVDIDANGEMALCEYLIFINNRDPIKFATNPQGEVDKVKMAALESKLAELDGQLTELSKKEGEAKQAEAAARASQAIADEAAAKAKAAEDAVRAVEDEAQKIADEIKAEEQAKADEIARLEALSTDQSVGIVKRNMAVQQLAAAKNEDPLPLRKAKLTQEAVVRKLAKVTAAAAVETAKANETAAAAKLDADAAADATRAVQAQLALVQESIAEVEKELEELRNQPSSPMGALWWTARTLEEKKKSLPTRMW